MLLLSIKTRLSWVPILDEVTTSEILNVLRRCIDIDFILTKGRGEVSTHLTLVLDKSL